MDTPSHLAAIFQEAQWIWPDSLNWDLYNCYALFRKTFALKSRPSKAPFFITADQSYQLYVNGRYVCRGPARGFQRSWPYDEVDLEQWLIKGKNVIAVRAFNPGRSNFQYVHQGYAGFLAAAKWGGLRIVTDKTWKCRRQTGVNRNTTPTSLQLFPQEDIDLRLEDPGWSQPGYEEDASWTPHEIGTTVWNGMPWYALEERGIPLLEEKIIPAAACLGEAKGKSRQAWRSARNIAINRFEEGLSHRPVSIPVETLHYAPSRKGHWRSYLIDFGKVVVGSVILNIEGADGGEAVETFHGETINSERLEPDFLPEAHCRMAFSHRLTCGPGKQDYQFYHTFGFRYMVLTVRDNGAPIRIKTSLCTTLYPHKVRGRFRSSEASLEKIWEACAWTERICSMDAYVDTPWREQAQWWGDARMQAWNTFHLSGDSRLFRRGIRQIGAQTAPSGITYGHAPTMAHGCILPDFTLIWMATMWDEYWQTGSPDSFLSQQATIESALAYFQQWTDPKTGLLRYDDRYWLFLDWTDIQRAGSPSVYNFWLLYTLDRLSALYHIARKSAAAKRCQRWASQVRSALIRLQRPDGLISDGILPNGKINPHCSVHTQTLALMTRLFPRQESTLLDHSLLPFLRGETRPAITPSAYWITYVYTEAALRGYGREVIADIAKKWADMADYGSTYEGFQSMLGNESRSHAWSAHPLFHLMQIIGGIRQTAQAWQEITYAPIFHGQYAESRIPSPKGDILSEWKRVDSSQLKGVLQIPSGITATVALPGRRSYKIEGPCRHPFTSALPSEKLLARKDL